MNAKHGTFGIVLAAVVAAAALTVTVTGTGCDRQPTPKTGSAQPPPDYNQKMEQSHAAAQAAMDNAAEAAKARAAAAEAKVADAASDVKNSDAAKNAQATATDTAAKIKEQGAELLGKLDASIKAHRLDEAQTYVDAFDRMKANVPDDLKARYESLKTQLKAAKDKTTAPQPAQPAPTTPAEPNK